MKRINLSSGAPWEPIVGYSRLVRVGDRVYVTGTTGLTPEGGRTEGAYAQTRQALENIAAALARVGATLDDVVRTRIFVTDIRRDWREVGRAHAEALGHVSPACTMVEIRRLIDDWMVVEVEVDAEVGARSSVAIGEAGINEADALAALLRSVDLPAPGPEDAPVSMLVARDAGRILGCVGVERHPPFALLRSLAVPPEARGRGVGGDLVRELLLRLRAEATPAVYLLTFDAQPFFARFGFSELCRESVPEPIRQSRELQPGGCDGAACMELRLK